MVAKDPDFLHANRAHLFCKFCSAPACFKQVLGDTIQFRTILHVNIGDFHRRHSTSFLMSLVNINEPGHEKMCLMSYANNKGADQPALPRSLISAIVVRCLDSVMSLVSVTKISNLMLASVAEQASLSLTWPETPEDTFSHDEAQIHCTV